MGDVLFNKVQRKYYNDKSMISEDEETTSETHQEFSDAFEAKEGVEKLKSVLKLCFIIGCYTAAFISMVQLGFWLVGLPHFHPMILPTDFITWIEEKWRHGIWWDIVTKSILTNSALLLGFFVQHTLMSQRVLDGTAYWLKFHYVYKIDRPIYVLATAIALQGIVRLWQPVPVTVWTMSWIHNYYQYVHIFAWISLYGTSIMMDLPDLVGFNQVVISSPTVTQKSPDLQIMYRTQRHMGFLPFMLMLLVHPQMTLDRFVLTIFLLSYTYGYWRSPYCYDYACRMKNMKRRRL